jgi:3-hydroxybutyryl-CoA dehydrogenase
MYYLSHMNISSVCVCGAGTMGSGIAQVAATAGFPTVLYEVKSEVLTAAERSIDKSLQTAVEKGKLTTEKRDKVKASIRFTTDLDDCKADLVIEAIIEKADVKISLFNTLAALNGQRSIFASNTSSLSISRIAESIAQPERVAGLHFFNPAPLMKLVEVVKGSHTSDEVISALLRFAEAAGKTPVVCKDVPGFIVNRVARPYYIEALRLVEEGIADFDTIDRLLESRGFKLGPFKLMDLIGNDINYAVSCSVHEQLHSPARLAPSGIQKKLVAEGSLGRKTGRGYYNY